MQWQTHYHAYLYRLVDGLPITHKEISHATRVDPVLFRVLEFVRCGWSQHIEDLLLKLFFHRRYELSIEQDCLVRGIRVVIPIRYRRIFWTNCM